ncbi:8865_t:CDS:2 [Funneliformis geosporum]|uniref:5512_t:CDS:1 n=1 Tax=Funneliformis geosporum TaxID=1117311 RepID=A0A9W4SHZ6_9GLOM|nr:5512_t:CDS:2 [Funneliformis geosporum]CAI2169205.1 8865_t:CDS:2 [Funneliformis geosporum]
MSEETINALNTTISTENEADLQLSNSEAEDSNLDPSKEFDKHDSQHGTMAVILLAALFGFQLLILYWKSKHYRSFQAVTLFGLWLIPMYLFGLQAHFWRFLSIWVLYSIANSWVLSRDFVEICTDRMASTLGYYNKDGFPRKHLRANICAICGVAATGTNNNTNNNENGDQDHKVFQLACRHVFHDDCIRGWCLIGKKDICPYCKEKVDLKEFKTNPWDTQQQLYLSLLDGVRYLVVWQPVIFAFVQLAYHIFGLE